ncbi:isoprenylcysteine carboxylmethyltransferase family protein [Roseivirga sp.]|uniref:methyltransferase family protein n=1 Tax=Roseivirga sp. TaxID=1964215 RepID=UPI002B27809C|nr:isoprenylcysteine carboxylmethyltransferase family protein [Roseivirga sp.]
MLLNHLIFFGCWALFYTIHSLLASNGFKNKTPLNPRAYRLVYSIFSTLSFGFILLLGASIYSGFVLPPSPATTYFGLMIATFGLFVIKRSFRNYSLRVFLGFKKETSSKLTLKKDKLQSKIRHPLYTGTILLFLGYFIYNPLLVNLISLVALLAYLPFGIRLEEKKLIQQFGDEYLQYKKDTPALFPKIKFS